MYERDHPAIGPWRVLFAVRKQLDDCLVVICNCYKQHLTVRAVSLTRMMPEPVLNPSRGA